MNRDVGNLVVGEVCLQRKCGHTADRDNIRSGPQRTEQATLSQRPCDGEAYETCVFYETCFTPGGCHVPSPGGRIEGDVGFGQYRRITR